MIEVAGRLSGGYFSSHMIPGYNGIDLVNIAIEISLNKKIEKCYLKKKYLNYVSQRFIFSDKIGVIKKVKIPQWIKKSKNILFFDLNIKKGSRIKKISNHTDRIGQVIVKSKSKKYSKYLANKICESIKIQIN